MLVLGSGEGGKFLAWYTAKSGHRTAVVERKLIGGSCPNTNCLPSKNEIWSAKVADLVHRADRFGIAMHLDRYKASGAELIMGMGRFIAPKTIEVRLNLAYPVDCQSNGSVIIGEDGSPGLSDDASRVSAGFPG